VLSKAARSLVNETTGAGRDSGRIIGEGGSGATAEESGESPTDDARMVEGDIVAVLTLAPVARGVENKGGEKSQGGVEIRG
jgi:hypothetical protein